MEQLKIFISFASEDRAQAREIHQRLTAQGYQPWLDDEDLLPGQDFKLVIERSLTSSDFVIICLSQTSVAKRSFFQREIKHALDKLLEMRPEDIFVIPARLDDCALPDELKNRHWVNLFEERGWEKLFKALELESARRGKTVVKPTLAQPAPSAPSVRSFDFVTARTDEQGRIVGRTKSQAAGFEEDLGGGIRLQMVEVPEGFFRMGSTEAEVEAALADLQRYNKDAQREWYEWETPRHRASRVRP